MNIALRDDRARIAILAFTALYVAGFGVWFFITRNEEFVSYMVIVIAVFALVVGLSQWLGLPDYVLGLLSLAGLMHLAGGGVMAGGDVLYAYHLVTLVPGNGDGFYVLRYDQGVHALGYGIAALALWHVLARHAPSLHPAARAFFAAAGAMGIGSVNEVFEFIAFVSFAHTGVGDYYNNSLDLVFNALGASAAALGALAALGRARRN